MNSNVKTAIFWVVLVCIAVLLWTVVKTNAGRQVSELSFTDFVKQVEAGRVVEVTISGTEVSGKLQGNTEIRTVIPAGYDKIYDLLTEKNVVTRIKEPSSGNWVTILVNAVPFVLLLAFWIFMMRQMQSGGNKALSFGKSRARMHSSQQKKVTFKDVAGVEEAKEELQEIIEFLREPQKFQKLGGRIPKGVLLIGPPGTGKTLLARAIAGEANVPFFSISGSDFVEMFVGVGASRVRDLFKQAKDNSPCIIFLDEIDAVGRRRGAGYNGGGHDEREQTLNAILVEMDGFDTSDQVIVIAATNRVDVLDPALIRPGRFDRQVYVPLPDVKGRLEILRVHAKKIKLGPGVDLHRLARGTPMFSGADLAAIINEAALLATMANKDFVDMADLEEARDKVRWGRARRSREVDEKERLATAYHEAGHALAQVLLPDTDPLHKVSIIPRGPYGGATFTLPEKDRMTYGRKWVHANLRVLCAGRIAEELFCQDVNTGASMDIRQATELARKMVIEWGMSDEVGFVYYGEDGRSNFWGIPGAREYSEETARLIDAEIKKILDTAFRDTRQLLTENRDKLHNLAMALLKYETLEADEVKRVIEGESLDRPTISDILDGQTPSERKIPAEVPKAKPIIHPPNLGPGPLPQPG